MRYTKGGFAPHSLYAAILCCYWNGGSSNIWAAAYMLTEVCSSWKTVFSRQLDVNRL